MINQETKTRTRTKTRPELRGWTAEQVGVALTSWVDRLPLRWRRLLPKDLVGFAMLGTFTFLIDLALLTLFKEKTSLPTPVDVALSYIGAFSLNFVLNRTLNFRSHAPVGGQALKFALVSACDFGFTVGITTGLTDGAGLAFPIARLIAAATVAVFTFSCARWWVFNDVRRR
jgi:putative flippase GtrA